MWFKVLLLIITYVLLQLLLIFNEGMEILFINIEELIKIIWR